MVDSYRWDWGVQRKREIPPFLFRCQSADAQTEQDNANLGFFHWRLQTLSFISSFHWGKWGIHFSLGPILCVCTSLFCSHGFCRFHPYVSSVIPSYLPVIFAEYVLPFHWCHCKYNVMATRCTISYVIFLMWSMFFRKYLQYFFHDQKAVFGNQKLIS